MSAELTVPAERVGRDRRRELLIEVAADLAAEDLEAVTMDTVAAAAGVSRPLVYKHFANRDELLAAVYRREARLLHKAMAGAVLEAPTLEDKFRTLIRGALDAQAERGAMLHALRAAGGRDMAGRMEQKGRDVDTFRYFTTLAVAATGADEPKTAAVITVLLRSIEGVLAEWRRKPTSGHARRLEEAYVTVCRGALAQLGA